MSSVCIIGVYFGPLPKYFNLWLKSAEKNNNIHFLVFSDQIVEELPVNVRFERISLAGMQELASSKLGFEVNLKRPYKCCDFKPAYGLIFEDYIREYSHWGSCDFDLIWGDIECFLEKYQLLEYDRFLSLGHLSIYRNTYKCNRLFMLPGSKVGNYKTVFTDEHNFAFDEFNGINEICEANNIPFFTKRIFADISSIYQRFRLALNDENYDYQVFYWEDGKVYRSFVDDGRIERQEFIYIHFKNRNEMDVYGDCVNASRFFIGPKGFIESDASPITIGMIDDNNRFISKTHEKRELSKFIRNERINRIFGIVKKQLGIESSIRYR